MKAKNSQTKTPLFSLFKRDELPIWKKALIYAATVIVAVLVSVFLAMGVTKAGFLDIFKTINLGATQTPWKLVWDSVLLMGFGAAILPAFKMKYWNMGANGQVLVACLTCCLMMFYWKEKFSNNMLIIIMFLSSLVISVLWATIPAIFKAFFNTNETLFTLMTNYIAVVLVAYFNFRMTKGKKDTPGIINLTNGKAGWLPTISNEKFILPTIIVLIVIALIYVYVKYTKWGYEATVMGDSKNTARYVGMNTKWITIRTLIISGAVCGVIGFCLAAGINHSVAASNVGSLGFTAVLVAWLSNFNVPIMLFVSFALAFLENGTAKVSSVYRLGSNDLSSVIFGLIFFSILIAGFIVKYRVKLNINKKAKEEEVK